MILNFLYFFILTINFLNYSCYKASASLFHKDTQTIYIPNFINQSNNIIDPFIGNEFAIKLQNKFLKNTNLILINNKLADLIIIGKILSYNFISLNNTIISNTIYKKPYFIYNRLKINLHIIFKSKQEPNKNFSTIFSNYLDFEGPKNINDPILKYQVIPVLKKKLINQIFNKITINW